MALVDMYYPGKQYSLAAISIRIALRFIVGERRGRNILIDLAFRPVGTYTIVVVTLTRLWIAVRYE